MQQEIQGLISLFEARAISRRGFAEGILALCVTVGGAGKASAQVAGTPVVHARTLNHISIYTADVARSKAFYDRLTGLVIRDEGPDYCEFRLENGFLGLYAGQPGQPLGINHLCLGVDGYDAQALVGRIERAIPQAKPVIENGDQVYVHDPDGAKVQFADANYKR